MGVLLRLLEVLSLEKKASMLSLPYYIFLALLAF